MANRPNLNKLQKMYFLSKLLLHYKSRILDNNENSPVGKIGFKLVRW